MKVLKVIALGLALAAARSVDRPERPGLCGLPRSVSARSSSWRSLRPARDRVRRHPDTDRVALGPGRMDCGAGARRWAARPRCRRDPHSQPVAQARGSSRLCCQQRVDRHSPRGGGHDRRGRWLAALAVGSAPLDRLEEAGRVRRLASPLLWHLAAWHAVGCGWSGRRGGLDVNVSAATAPRRCGRAVRDRPPAPRLLLGHRDSEAFSGG
jgi:hypothetical protein